MEAILSAKEKATEISVLEISQGEVSFAIVGSTPLVFNRMSEKAKELLLLPRGRLTDADKAARLKHNPVEEFRASVYRNGGDAPATRLKFPAAGLKRTMQTAALDLPGTKRTEVGRLAWAVGEYVDVYGVPELKMDVVRSADINRTPDIRTRAILREWACTVTIRFVQPKLNARGIANLLAAGGVIAGIGDGRQEKGALNFGQFRLVDLDDTDFLRITAEGGRAAQDAALDQYRCYDEETENLLNWYSAEVIRRGRDKDTGPRRRKDDEA